MVIDADRSNVVLVIDAECGSVGIVIDDRCRSWQCSCGNSDRCRSSLSPSTSGSSVVIVWGDASRAAVEATPTPFV